MLFFKMGTFSSFPLKTYIQITQTANLTSPFFTEHNQNMSAQTCAGGTFAKVVIPQYVLSGNAQKSTHFEQSTLGFLLCNFENVKSSEMWKEF